MRIIFNLTFFSVSFIIAYMNYIGSKFSIVDFIISSVDKTLKQNKETRMPDEMVFADLMAGTGVVSGYFKELGYSVIANDIQFYSYAVCKHVIESSGDIDSDRCENLIAQLNALQGIEGFIYKNYSLGGTKGQEFERMYFSDENARKCDAMRIKIEEWKNSGYIDESEYYFLLGSLINSIDKYANTASVYGAFLKSLKKSALKPMKLTPLQANSGTGENKVYNEDIFSLIKKVKGDILYLDPPYNARQYCTNYHLLETIAKYDSPQIYGKTGLREYSKQKSVFCNKGQVAQAFNDLVKNADFNYIFLSYNNEGLMSFDTIGKIMKKYGKYTYELHEHKRFKADNARESKADKTVEYLHCLIKK